MYLNGRLISPTIKTLSLVAMFLLLSACASITTTVVPKLEILDIPPAQTIQRVELGDTILSKGKTYTYDAIDLSNQVQAGGGLFFLKFTIPPQQLIAKLEDDKWTYYYGENVTAYDSILGTTNVSGGLKVEKTLGKRIAMFGKSTSATFTPKPDPIFKFTRVTALDQSSFSQELIYNGRTNNNVKFLYRELFNSQMRAPFTQEVQYDLSKSNVIGFKGVRIEIIEATNIFLEYKVINSFPDPS